MRKQRHASLFDHHDSNERRLPLRVRRLDPSAPKSRWEAHIRDEQSGEKRRESERGEPITQRAEKRLLPLPDLAEESGLLDDEGAPLRTMCLVGAQGCHWLALVGEAPGQNEGIFQGLTRPLSEVGGWGMSGIAQQGHTVASEVSHRATIVEIVAQDGLLVGGLDQVPDGLSPTPKESREVLLPFPCGSCPPTRQLSVEYQNTRPSPIGSMPKRRPRPQVSLEMPRETCWSSKRATPRQQV